MKSITEDLAIQTACATYCNVCMYKPCDNPCSDLNTFRDKLKLALNEVHS